MSRYTEKRENEKYTMYDLDYSEKKKVENERQTLYDLEYSEKYSKTWKMRNAHCRTCSMVSILKILENEKLTL